MKKTFLALAVLSGMIASGIKARPTGPQRMPAEEMATRNTDMISERLGLADKQYKKVYKLYLRQAREIENSQGTAMRARMQGGPGGEMRGAGPGGRGPGNGGPGGMRGGGMQGGGPGGRSGEGFDGIPGGQRRPMAEGTYEEPEKNVQKRDRKMKKILSSEQYDRWAVIEKEMQYGRFRENFMKMDDKEVKK